jgi:cytochrome c peroxidase
MRGFLLALTLAFSSTGALAGCRDRSATLPRTPRPPIPLGTVYADRLDSLDTALAALAALPNHPDSASARQAFRGARAAYKRVEYLLEYVHHYEAPVFNSPTVPIVDEDDYAHVIVPRGLQVIELAVFPRLAKDFTAITRRQVDGMREVVRQIRQDLGTRTWSPEAPFEAARLELARVVTLGLAGFDASLSGDGARESAEALRGVKEGLESYRGAMWERDSAGWKALQRSLDDGIVALDAAPDFERFDRFAFQVRFAGAIARELGRLHRSLELSEPDEIDPWSPGATDIYAVGAIDSRWFAPDYAPAPTRDLVALGRQLFFNPALSSTRRRSCATCHQPSLAFSDRRRVAAVDPGSGRVRNTPTLLNAGLQRTQFADQRVLFLEFQFEQVMSNPREMALAPDDAARRLSEDSVLRAHFATAFGQPETEAVTAKTLSLAVAAYVRSLEALDSRFDRAIRGDTNAVTASERRGFNLFMGKGACGTCHFAPLFGGTTPPEYLESEPEVIGVPATRSVKNAVVDPDPGVFAIDRAPLHRHAFKTPTVRNVAVTAPYMHNGVFRTLEEVIDFYDRGGGNGLGMRLPHQTLSSEPLHLSKREKRDLAAFLRSLTDSTSVTPSIAQVVAGPTPLPAARAEATDNR